MEGQALLTIAGAAAELAGLGLVVFDVRHTRRSARRARQQYAPPEPMTFPVAKSFSFSYEVEGKQPPLHERVERLEQVIADVRTDYLHRIDTLQSQLREEAFERIRTTMDEAEERERGLREFISNQLDSGVGRRVAGTILFACGVILSAAGNLVG
jgi:hypothetical protein